MKELFSKLIEPNKRNEISALDSFKLWLVFAFCFLFYNCLVVAFLHFIQFAHSLIPSLLVEKFSLFLTYIVSVAYELNLITVAFIFTIMGTKMHWLPRTLLPIHIVFPSTQHRFIFCVCNFNARY